MRVVPARNGWFWLVRGFLLYRMNPPMWTLLVFTYWILVALLNLIPFAGPLIATLLLPAFSVSFMAVCRELEERRPIRPALLLAGLRTRLPALITLGGLYLVSIMIVLGISTLADGGSLANWIIYGDAPDAKALRDGSLSRALIVAAIAGTPVVMAFWFAPVLSAWDEMNPLKALFFSFFAGWRNWRAFLVYGAVVSVFGVVFSAAIVTATIVFGGKTQVMRFGMIAAVLVSMPTLFGSFFAAYRDVFPRSPPGQTPAP